MTTTPFSSRKLSAAQLELLERRLRGAGGTGRGIPGRPAEEPVPLSPAQHGVWVVGQFLADNTLYSVHRELWLRGPLDAGALRHALDELVRRHEILRTTYRGDTEAVQVIGPARGAAFDVVDARGTDRAVELAGAELRRPFDLERGPVFRATLFRVSGDEHLLVLTMHHLVSDGWSCGILGRELGTLYAAYARDLPHGLPELPIQYADFAHWQANRLDGELRERQLDHWRGVLDGVAPVLQLPTDRPRPARPSHRAGRVSRDLSPGLTMAVRDLAANGGVTLFTVLLAAFGVVLRRCAGQDTFAVGSLTSGRESADVEHLLGLFANTVAIPADLSGDPAFTELLARTHRTVLGALGHQDVSFEQVVAAVQPARDPARNPLFQVLFQLVQVDEEIWDFGGLDVRLADLHNESGKVDLALFATDHGDRIELEIEYATDLFEPATGAWYAERVLAVLTQVAADPYRPLSSVDVLPDGERELVVSTWNATDLAVPRATLSELFEAEVRRVPSATAIVDVDRSVVTYAELNARANRLAHHLRAAGVRCESIVGVCVEHSVDMLVALLGVLKAGGAYVPLDPGLPAERLSYMLEDTGARVVVTQAAVSCALPPEYDGDVVTLDADPALLAGYPGTDPVPVNGPDNLVYVMYTSGSTGRPKGVMISHHGLVNYLWWAVEGYGLEGRSGAPMLGSIAFDLSVPNFFLPLIGGRDVTLLPKDRSLEALAALLRTPGDFSLLKLTPGHLDVLRGMIPEPGAVDSVRTFVVGADEVRPETVVAWRQIAPNARIIDEYGPTETVVGCSVYTVGDDFDPSVPVSIGRPIANTQMYVLDAGFAPVPVGVVGELFIGGFGVARGYLNRRGLTADKFVPDPFSATEGARMYRTGDLARFRVDGDLEFLGRIDHQVKIRGYRIELGEIEARLLLHPGVSEAVVVARRDASGGKRLVAYLVTGTDAGEVREFVAHALPGYMVPTAWVVLPEMPLTAAGKVDRDALPEPAGDRDASMGGYVAARTPAEATLAGIWSRELGVDQVGVHDDFFALGGDSILAIRIVAHARRAGLDLSVRQVFECRTVGALAEPALEEPARRDEQAAAVDGGLPALDRPELDRLLARLGLTPADAEDVYPLSPLQSGMVFNSLNDADPEDYLGQVVFAVRGPLDADAFARAWQQVADRHAVLRSLYVWDGLPAPVQVALRNRPIRFDVADWTDEDPSNVAARLRELMAEVRRDGFDLAAGCPSRFTLVRVGPDLHHFVWTFHHIVIDAWSVSIVLDEVFTGYEALRDGRTATLPDAVPYRDHIAWLSGRDTADGEEFWRTSLAGFTGPTALPEGPADGESGVDRVRVELAADLAASLRLLAQRCGSTVNTVLHTAWALLVSRYTGADDVLFGTAVSGRAAGVPGIERIVGLLINTLPTRVGVRPDRPVSEFLRERHTALLELRDHEHSALADVRRHAGVPAGTPLFDTVFSYENFAGDDGRPVAGLEIDIAEGFEQTDCPLVIEVNHHDTVTVVAHYQRSRFDRDTCTRLLADYRTLIRGMVEHPDEPLSRLDTMDPAARDAVLGHARAPEVAVPDRPVHALVSEQARLRPGATAVRYGDRRLTYRELDARANQVAHELAARGVTRGSMVAVCLRGSEHLPVVLLGVLKAGAAYLPLDAAYPAERLAFMMTDAGATAVVTEDDVTLPTAEAGVPDTAVVSVDADAGAIAARPDTDPAVPSGAQDLAYVIYTSGSTGTPKSVAIEHGSVVWLVHADYVRLGPDDVVAQASDPTFDAVTFEIWGALVNGAELAGIPKDTMLSPELLSAALRRERVSVMYLTTALFNQLAGTDPTVFSSVDTLLFGGDAVNRQRVERVLEAGPPRRLLHMYGPTETTAFCTWTRVGDLTGSPTVSIGRPMVNTQAYVLDGRLEPVPFGVVGEIWIGGLGVARGYLGRPGLTAERFVPDPFRPGARMYRTGDTGWLRADGMLEFQGRIDRQTKVRGYRIELGEIEARLAAHPAVRDAVVVVRSEGPAHKRLVAYVVPESGEGPGTAGLREFLERSLPDYMVPAAWMTLDRLPLTPAGKVDRRALPDPHGTRGDVAVDYRAPESGAEDALAEVWARVLGVDRVGVLDDFFELGGDSILAIQVVSGARQAGLALTVRQVFELRTVGALAAIVEPTVAEPDAPDPAPEPAGFPLSGLDAESLAVVGHDAEDVYRLSPLQAGMLVDSLSADGPDPYFRQWAWDLDGALDVGAFGRAWQHVVDRHPILRTHFAWEGLPHPVQVVSRAFPVAMERWDCRSEPDRAAWLDRLMADENDRGVALDGAPPLRLVVVRTGERAHRFVWNTHHVLVDGWSRTLILDEVLAVYRALVSDGRLPELPAAVPFRDFVAWLERGPEDAAAYWAGAFAGFAGPYGPPLAGGGRPTGRMGVAEHVPDAGVTAAWRATARRYGVTAGTVAQAAWALLLAAHGGRADVAFGVTVAGRSADLPGVDRIAGMLINTVPERVVIDPARGVGEWLRSLHDGHVARQAHEHHALTDIHRWAGMPAGRSMFDTRFVFEGGPSRTATGRDEPSVTEVSALGGEVEYPLVLAVGGGDDAAVQLRYDRGCYDEPTALRLLAEYVRLLGALTGADPDTRLDALASLPEPGRAVRPAPAPVAGPSRAGTTAPRTPAERSLAGIWTEILGVADVGVHDDFFDLGGDSILVFRVVTRAREAGLRLTVRQALRQRTIAELAAALAEIREPEPEQRAEPSGDVPLTPILRRFTERDIDHDHHNQAMLLSWYQAPDPDRVDRALRAVAAHHEALRFRLGRDGGEWRLTVAEGEDADLLRVVDLAGVPAADRDAVVDEVAGEVNRGMDLAAGPLVRAALFEDRLLIAVHHVAVDTVSWTVLLDDLADAYRSLGEGEPVELRGTGTSYRRWAHGLAEYAEGDWFAEESAYWLAPRPETPDLPLDRPDGANTQDGERELETVLSAEATEALLRDAPKVLGCRVDEVLLGAVAYALSRWTGADGATVDVEGHGREPLTDDVDLGRTIGWFTAVHPIHLHLPATGGPARRAAAVREQLRAVPHRGVSYGLARYLCAGTAAALAARPVPQVIVTHHGRLSGHPDPRALFDATSDTPGATRGPANRRAYTLAVDTAVVGGRAVVSWTYSETLHDRATIERVMGLCVDELEALAGLCRLGAGGAPSRPSVEPGRLAERLFPHAPAVVTPMARHRVPGAGLALISDGELVSAWGEGVTGGENPVPVGPDTVFQACSVSKHVTALAVMRLVQEGRLDLDRDIGTYLTAWRPPERGITLRGLLSHTAGLSVFRHPGYRRGSRVPGLLQVLDGVPPANTPRIRRERPPGECRYSCGNYSVVEQVVVDVTGLPFAEAMRSLVLGPLGMAHSGYEQDLPGTRPGGVAYGHLADGTPYDGGWRVFPELASSGLWTTPGDLARVALEVQRAAAGAGGVFLSQEAATEMVTPVDAGYGLGTTTVRDRDAHWFGHPGDKHSHQTLMATDLRSGVGLVAMFNIGGAAPVHADLLNELGVHLNYLIR